MFIECRSGRLAALLGCRKTCGFQVVFSDSRWFRCRVVQEGDLAVCGIGVGRAREVEKRGV